MNNPTDSLQILCDTLSGSENKYDIECQANACSNILLNIPTARLMALVRLQGLILKILEDSMKPSILANPSQQAENENLKILIKNAISQVMEINNDDEIWVKTLNEWSLHLLGTLKEKSFLVESCPLSCELINIYLKTVNQLDDNKEIMVKYFEFLIDDKSLITWILLQDINQFAEISKKEEVVTNRLLFCLENAGKQEQSTQNFYLQIIEILSKKFLKLVLEILLQTKNLKILGQLINNKNNENKELSNLILSNIKILLPRIRDLAEDLDQYLEIIACLLKSENAQAFVKFIIRNRLLNDDQMKIIERKVLVLGDDVMETKTSNQSNKQAKIVNRKDQVSEKWCESFFERSWVGISRAPKSIELLIRSVLTSVLRFCKANKKKL